MLKSKIKYISLFASIIMLLVGLLVMLNPLNSNIFLNYIIVLALGVTGISRICKFAAKDSSDVWDLVIGILALVACISLFSGGAALIETTAGYAIGILLFVDAISHFITAGDACKAGLPMSWFIICGILEILLGLCLFCFPIWFQVVYAFMIGIFMIIYAVILLVEALLIKTDVKAKK